MPTLLPIPERIRPKAYGRRQPLVLLNGLAEQAESWFKNRRYWARYFDVYAPNILVYDGEALHERLASGLAITVDYLVEQLHTYLTQFVQTPPYHLVASSLGGSFHAVDVTDDSIDIIQGGSPHTQSNNDIGPGYPLNDDPLGFKYAEGQLILANNGQPNSSGGQFFFSTTAAGVLQHALYNGIGSFSVVVYFLFVFLYVI